MSNIGRLFLALIAASAVTFFAPPAHADSADLIKQLSIDYTVQPSGLMHVRETFVWKFGCCAERHGIQRELITREPDADNPGKDIVYGIRNFTASSPDPVPTEVTKEDVGKASDRNRSTVYRIGDPNRTIWESERVTYVLEYDVVGALRHFDDHDELYWDATGSGNPEIKKLSNTARVPGGAQEVRCFSGPIRSNDHCGSAKIVDKVAHFRQTALAAGDNVSIGVAIKSGLVADNAVHLVGKASVISVRSIGAGLIGLLLTVGTPVTGWWLVKKWRTDERYLDLPPGTTPTDGTTGRVGPDPGPVIPVAFTPPDIPAAEAAQLIANKASGTYAAATIVELAVHGAITVEHSPQDVADALDSEQSEEPDSAVTPDHGSDLSYKLVRVDGADDRLTSIQTNFRDSIFGDEQRVELTPGRLENADYGLRVDVATDVSRRGWFFPARGLSEAIVFGLCTVWAVALAVAGWLAAAAGVNGGVIAMGVMIVIVALVLTIGVQMPRIKRGKRSAAGRAMLDRVEGFRTYLTTAEADQLRFEEGEDIFSRYLPWAIIFGVTNRWQMLCQQLVADGRLPDTTPAWYASSDGADFGRFHSLLLTNTITTSLTAPPPVSSGSTWGGGSGFSGGGFGSGGSAFSGGGFSGGGGGGGGSSSW